MYGSLAAKIAGVKKIFSLLEGLGFCYTNNSSPISLKRKVLKCLQTMLYRISLPLCNKVFFLNKDDFNDLIIDNKITIKNYEIIGGIGVNLEEFSYKQPKIDKIHFGMVSRLLVEKGIREFVLAASQVKKIS
ncbi:hypothetical protein ACTQYY_24435 [Escherichia coli]|uniref:hypothetical protein n=1 Tax=Escherichia coli TaxID=562 RepID=UPI0024ACDE18|nr:hypothetical protein [Escherichia coli]WHG14278.1 hypothetical protein QDY31_08695 [Escherichia coli]